MIICWHVDEERIKSVKQLLTKAILKKTYIGLHLPKKKRNEINVEDILTFYDEFNEP